MTITRYVAVSGGSDSDDGESAANAWATVAYAKTQLRALIAANPTEDIVLKLGDGRHAVTATLEFTDDDSPAHPYTAKWEPVLGAEPIISGGVVVDTWTLHDAPNNIWVADYTGGEIRQLYVDGIRCYRARRVTGLSGTPTATAAGYDTDDALTDYGNISDVEFIYSYLWRESRIKVASAVSGVSVTMQTPAQTYYVVLGDAFAQRLPTAIENAYEILEANAEPGTFYWDRTAQKIYLVPPTAVANPTAAEIIVPALEKLMTLDDAARIDFDGISFQHGSWLPENGGFADIQWMVMMDVAWAGFQQLDHYGTMSPGCIEIRNSSRIRFLNGSIKNMGAHGISIQDGCDRITMIGNAVEDNSGHGILIGRPACQTLGTSPRRITLQNNAVGNNALEYQGCVGICRIYARDTLIEHNEISYQPYSGLGQGWGWGNTKYHNTAPNINNIVRNNWIHDCMRVMSDGAAFYTVGQERGGIIDGNYLQDDAERGIYTDQGSHRLTITNNVVENCVEWFKYHLAFGDYVVENNHSDTTANEYVTGDPGNDFITRPAGAVDWPYANATVYNPAAPTPAQAAIIANAGLEADYVHLRIAASPGPLPPVCAETNFSGVNWTIENLTPLADQVSPYGGLIATQMTITTANGNHRVYYNGANDTRIRKVFAKAGTASFIGITHTGLDTGLAIFNLSTGEIVGEAGGVATIRDVGLGWYFLTFEPSVAGAWIQLWFGETQAQVEALTAFVGTSKTLFIVGAQQGDECIV